MKKKKKKLGRREHESDIQIYRRAVKELRKEGYTIDYDLTESDLKTAFAANREKGRHENPWTIAREQSQGNKSDAKIRALLQAYNNMTGEDMERKEFVLQRKWDEVVDAEKELYRMIKNDAEKAFYQSHPGATEKDWALYIKVNNLTDEWKHMIGQQIYGSL